MQFPTSRVRKFPRQRQGCQVGPFPLPHSQPHLAWSGALLPADDDDALDLDGPGERDVEQELLVRVRGHALAAVTPAELLQKCA